MQSWSRNEYSTGIENQDDRKTFEAESVSKHAAFEKSTKDQYQKSVKDINADYDTIDYLYQSERGRNFDKSVGDYVSRTDPEYNSVEEIKDFEKQNQRPAALEDHQDQAQEQEFTSEQQSEYGAHQAEQIDQQEDRKIVQKQNLSPEQAKLDPVEVKAEQPVETPAPVTPTPPPPQPVYYRRRSQGMELG